MCVCWGAGGGGGACVCACERAYMRVYVCVCVRACVYKFFNSRHISSSFLFFFNFILFEEIILVDMKSTYDFHCICYSLCMHRFSP